MKGGGTDKVFGIFAGCVVALIVGWVSYSKGVTAGKADAVDKAVLADYMKQKHDADESLKSTEIRLAANKLKVDRLEKHDAILEDLKKKIQVQTDVHEKLKSDISNKQSELDSLTSRVQKTKDKPIDLPAGHFTVGTDIRAGRYQVTGDSNLIIRSSSGDTKVNTILGGGMGVDSYVCELEDGDKIEAGGSDRFHPIN